ncbi:MULTISPECIES: hypothetical protein [unclassified Streptomyces]|uniref:hypothetical protein n=1 Tax=unclassified Streptomyces TaxID=2593676 RepID=UPI002E0F1F82|nr:hypothetical protein OG452_12075 [Streptomyces sp. NBC_01197]WSS51302.1 hypothetical protein OG708_23300 [Streptomyces sp. NBC_01180]
MSLPDRKEEMVRRMLKGPHPPVPADLALRAAERGTRIRRRRTVARRVVWLLLTTVLVVFVVWATLTQPWAPPPARTTPPVEGY